MTRDCRIDRNGTVPQPNHLESDPSPTKSNECKGMTPIARFFDSLGGPGDSALEGRGNELFSLSSTRRSALMARTPFSMTIARHRIGLVLCFAEVRGWCFTIASIDLG